MSPTNDDDGGAAAPPPLPGVTAARDESLGVPDLPFWVAAATGVPFMTLLPWRPPLFSQELPRCRPVALDGIREPSLMLLTTSLGRWTQLLVERTVWGRDRDLVLLATGG